MVDTPSYPPAQRLAAVQEPVIPIIADLIATTPDTISLGQGTVFYDPPVTAWENVSKHRKTFGPNYSQVQGEVFLHEQLWQKLQTFNRVSDTDDYELVVTAGANMGFLHAIMAITDPGDEVILPKPFYFNHDMAIEMLSCKTIGVDCTDTYQLDLDRIHSAITPRTKAIVTVSPNNPAGVVYTQESLCALNQLCRENNLYHISDEAYEYFTFDEHVHYSPASNPEATEHTISLFSFSKAYGFSSWRVGYMLIPKRLFATIRKIQDTNLICAPLASQYAAAGALQTGMDYCQEQLAQIQQNRLTLLSELRAVDGIINEPVAEGAFYIFIKLASELSDFAVAEKLIREFRVAVIPGSAFGMQQGCYLRIAYGALDTDNLSVASQRLTQGLNNLTTC